MDYVYYGKGRFSPDSGFLRGSETVVDPFILGCVPVL